MFGVLNITLYVTNTGLKFEIAAAAATTTSTTTTTTTTNDNNFGYRLWQKMCVLICLASSTDIRIDEIWAGLVLTQG